MAINLFLDITGPEGGRLYILDEEGRLLRTSDFSLDENMGFSFGEPISEEMLHQVATAEQALTALGLKQFRVRAHGDVARVEVEPSERQAAWDMREQVSAAIKSAGVTFAAQDLEGYRTGSLNEILQIHRDEPLR